MSPRKSNAQLRRERQARAYADLFGAPAAPAEPKIVRSGPVHLKPCLCGERSAGFNMPDRPEPYCYKCWSETPYGQNLISQNLWRLLGEASEDDGALRDHA